ncbi:alpha/beta fold hydrolase [Adhaeribacter aquaticus]|uniref:alpha/beta fold hydrolase n=1 Tax=Adhaeribacter aquaticus TaxID=299567 RepID=UPI000405EF73|nr:alpha/beta hydrolase [Adhaeribacter aquaticus]
MKKTNFYWFFVFVALHFYAIKGAAQTAGKEVYNAELTTYKYPYPVHFLNITLEKTPVKMAYMDVPPTNKAANAPVVVLLHGKNFFGAYWQKTAQFLSQNGFRVIMPDQVGFGKSTKASLHYSFHQLASNTKKLLDTLQVKKAIVVGHSMGGMLATRFGLMYPESTQKLVLENPIGLEDYRALVPFQPLDKVVANELKATEESMRNYHKTYYVAWKPEYEELIKAGAGQTRSPDFLQVAVASAQTYDMIYQQPVVHEFPLVKVPTLVIIGQEDRTVVGKAQIKDKEVLAKAGQYPQLGKKTAAAIKGAKLVELNNVGHIPHIEATDTFHRALLDFIK